MSRLNARIGDRTIGTCFAHDPPLTIGGTIVSGSPDTTNNNRLDARVGDLVRTDCGHTGTIVSGSASALTNERLVARIGDKITGVYVAEIITGSPNKTID